mgnify:CR=1 FL=1
MRTPATRFEGLVVWQKPEEVGKLLETYSQAILTHESRLPEQLRFMFFQSWRVARQP